VGRCGWVRRLGRFGRGWGGVGGTSGFGRGVAECGVGLPSALGGWGGDGLMSVSVVGWVACSGVAQGSKTGWLWFCERLKKPNFRVGG